MRSNKYSKFKYENNFNLKYYVDAIAKDSVILNSELKINKPTSPYSSNEPHFNFGQITVINNIFTCEQINFLDEPVAPWNKNKLIFFKF